MRAHSSTAALVGLLAFWARAGWGHRVTVSSLSSARASAEHGAASGANGSARGDCSYCRTVTDCYRYPSTCRGCQICSQVGGDVRLACPSYCSTPRDCVTLRSTCTPERCSHCGGSGGSGGGGGGGTRPGGDAEAVDRLMAELDELVGLDKVKDQMKELVAQVKFNMERERLGLPDIGGQSLHMSFLGNPGTGKTVVARIVGELMVAMGAIKPAGGRKEKDDIVVEVSRADLVAEYTGQTAPKVKQAVQKALGGVLFIDEAYALVQGDRDSFGNEAVDTLIKEMEDNRDKLIVILAGYQTEMATFLAANPGFKSRVAFHFAFPDYTCDELVQIGELLLSKKNVGIVPEPPTDGQASACYPPAGVPVPASCGWLRSGVRLRTGCCETKDCGRQENRANGNGRTVRNVLESSYRNMARRVLTTYTPGMLEEYLVKNRPSVTGTGKDAKPSPALSCGATFEGIRSGGPYMELASTNGADVRCAFRLLETADLQESMASAIQDQLSANCMAVHKPIHVNTTEILKTPGILDEVDWEKLHDSLFGGKECEEAQAMLHKPTATPAPPQGDGERDPEDGDGDELEDTPSAKLDGASLAELATNTTGGVGGRCPSGTCQSSADCTRYPSTCGRCKMCGGGPTSSSCSPTICTSRHLCYDRRCTGCSFCRGAGGSTGTRWPSSSPTMGPRWPSSSPTLAPQCDTACTSQWWCSAARDRCGGCRICQAGGGSGGIGGGGGTRLMDIECKVCGWAKTSLGHLGRSELNRIDEEAACRQFFSASGVRGGDVAGNMKECRDNLAKSLLYLRVYGSSFDCGTAVGYMCSSSPGGRPGGGFPGGVITRPDNRPIDLGEGRGPTSRPGSKVDSLVKELNGLIGLDGVKAGINALRDAVEFDMWRKRFLGEEWSLLGQSFHMRFLGNPGTGKTVVARLVGKILVELEVVKKSESAKSDELVFKEVSRADLVAGYVGQTAPKVMQAVKSAFGGVLFIDEAYSLVQDEKDSFGREAVDTLIKEIEDHRDKVIVIFAGYSNEMETFFEANPGFQSRVPFRFEFADYNCQELGGIGELQLSQQSIEPTATAKEWMNDVIMSKTGCCTKAEMDSGACAGATRDNGNGRAVRNILEGALRSMSVRAVAASQGGQATRQLVTELQEVDIAAVGGQLVAEALRGACKAANQAVPELEKLCTGGRILSVCSFKDLLQKSREDCAGATAVLEGLRSTTSVVDNAMDIEISDPKVKTIFDELDEYIGLLTVKRTMREMFTTVQFAQLRKQQGLEPLKSQSFHMRFLGNPGTGKTVVARVVGKLLVALGAIEKPSSESDWMFAGGSEDDEPIFNEVSRSDLVAEYVGQTANKTQHWIKESLGGVFFLDEAYALVQGDKDSFGQEAVDTLIKEMEDKRKSVIVICAGYANEMEEFFKSNPGFKSRVPFTFFFEDYTCSELSEIGKMQLEKKKLTMPEDLTSYEQSIRFSTGCCDRLEECEESKDKGNGRAVRNAVESSIRAMARRLADDKGQPDKTKYSTMLDEDFRATTAQMVESRLTVPCGTNGELQKITSSVMKAELGVLDGLPGQQAELVARVQRLAEETRLVEAMAGSLDPATVGLGNVCRSRLEMMTRSIHNKLQQVCDPGEKGILTVVQSSLQVEKDPKIVQMYANILSGIVRDEAFMREVLRAAWKDEDLEAENVPELEESCDRRMEDLRQGYFQVPFDFLTFR